jgi:hypothetical protein
VEAETNWLRKSIIRLRTALRFTKEPRVETVLREVIADAEDRLAVLEQPEEPSRPRAPEGPKGTS